MARDSILILGFVVALIAGLLGVSILVIELSLSEGPSMLLFGATLLAVGFGFGVPIKRCYAGGPMPLWKKKAIAIPMTIGVGGLVVAAIGLVRYITS